MLRFTTKLLAEVDERPLDVSRTSFRLVLMSARHMDTKHSPLGSAVLGVACARKLRLSSFERQLCTNAQGEIEPTAFGQGPSNREVN